MSYCMPGALTYQPLSRFFPTLREYTIAQPLDTLKVRVSQVFGKNIPNLDAELAKRTLKMDEICS